MLAVLIGLPLFGADAYLFTSFRRNGETRSFRAQQRRTEMDSAEQQQPWLRPEEARMLMRDPWLGQGPDGVWHMLWTWGWTAKEMGGKLKIGYASSRT